MATDNETLKQSVNKPLPNEVLRAIRQVRGREEDDAAGDAEINALGLDAVLREYLEWEGVQGYSRTIATIARHFGAK